MTAKREAELETENRMLREQVASLEKIVERMQYPLMQVQQPAYFLPNGNYYWHWPGYQVTCATDVDAPAVSGPLP